MGFGPAYGGVGSGSTLTVATRSDNNELAVFATFSDLETYTATPAGTTDARRINVTDQTLALQAFVVGTITNNAFVGDPTSYIRVNNAWVVSLAPLQGIPGTDGEDGTDGLNLDFKSRDALDTYFITHASTRLEAGLPVTVHLGNNLAATLIWNGPDYPGTNGTPAYVANDARWRDSSDLVANNSLYLGPTRISNAVEDIIINTPDGRKFLGVGVGFTTAGSSRLNDFEVGEETTLDVNLATNTVINAPFETSYTTFGDNLTNDIKFSPHEAGELRVQYWLGSEAPAVGATPFFDQTRTVTQDEVDAVTTARTNGNVDDQFIDFGVGNEYLLDMGVDIYVRFSGIRLRGGLVSGGPFDGQTIIAFRSDIQPFTRHPVARLSDIDQPSTAASITRFSITGQSQSILAGTTISGIKTFTYNVNHPEDVSGNLTLKQNGQVLKSDIAPTGSSFTQTITSVTLQNNASVTFELSGTRNDGSRISKTFSIRAHALAEKLYFGRSASNNPATVDETGFDSIEAGVDGSSVTTGTASANEYFIILTPTNHDISSITDTVLQQDVTDIFTKTENVRTIGSVSYNSFVIGPLVAGVDESYTLDF